MSPAEIIAYKGGDGSNQFADIEVIEGTEDQLVQLRKALLENWWNIAGEHITIVYQGTDLQAAKEAIKGLPRISEDAGL